MSTVGSELAIDQVGLKLAVIFLSLKGLEEWPIFNCNLYHLPHPN